jgi:hypothetical protein
MPLLGRDGDITTGWLRKKRPLLKRLYELTFLRKSPLPQRYAEGIAKVTGLSVGEVMKSRPFKEYVKRLAGLEG